MEKKGTWTIKWRVVQNNGKGSSRGEKKRDGVQSPEAVQLLRGEKKRGERKKRRKFGRKVFSQKNATSYRYLGKNGAER